MLPIVNEIFPGVYSISEEKNQTKRKVLATRNLTPGRVYYGERILKAKLQEEIAEFRLWDPFRSKLSAAILKGLKRMPVIEGANCLYLGASTGTTVSHLSDIIGTSGKIFAVEMAPRVARELLEKVVRFRNNIVPIIEDARHPERFSSIYGRVDIVYSDIAQPDQTEIAIENCNRFVTQDKKINGTLLLVVKASSIDSIKDKQRVFGEQTKILKQAGFDVLEQLDLEPYDRNHAIIVAKKVSQA
jgi:fibrillarin-like pre-rRNA processing protein